MNSPRLHQPAEHVGRDGEGEAADQILALIRSGAARTRAELIERTGLSRSTVSQRLSALLESKLVVGAGHATSTGGRRATILAFNGSAGAVIAVALGATGMRIALVDLAGTVLAERGQDHLIAEGPDATLEAVWSNAEALRKECGLD